ncbi:MAG TPA: HlyD family type I secretion periplasmic adaptor subunit [Parvularculaceae bacterium]|nr:HlyD family type I secretion periplasmic adaptor subunit [Amphiplicatus sp.]HPE30335.1 HlyD family type I secretion periplasmic adaptor subunit [Parvularculaceae bacterium]HRX39667.1 HlyD family type I secretion periplasmic adaptor subunit [Parvularculaceae bacterium]
MAELSVGVSTPKSEHYFRRLGYAIIGAVFGGLILWSILAPIEGAVVAGGQVVVESNRKMVQHLEGGMVKEILVREGQKVEAGEVLLRLDDTASRANVALIDSQLRELYARRARLIAERDSLDKVPPPEGLEAVLSQPAFADKLAGQQQLFEARASTVATQISLLEERVTQQHERIAGLKAQISSTVAQRKLIRDELDGVRELNEQGFAPMTRVRALEREAEKLDGQSGSLRSGVAEAESIISETQLEISRLKESEREDAIKELRDVEVSISQLEEKRIAAADTLDRAVIKAPQAGQVLGLSAHTVGGVVAAGKPIMEIVPEGDTLQVAARISPRDIDRVAVGQDTMIRFTAFSTRRTPVVHGVVKTVSADAMTDQVSGAGYYLALIDLPNRDELSKELNGQALAPGMPAESYIRTGKRPAISYFLKPLTDAFSRSMRDE